MLRSRNLLPPVLGWALTFTSWHLQILIENKTRNDSVLFVIKSWSFFDGAKKNTVILIPNSTDHFETIRKRRKKKLEKMTMSMMVHKTRK